MSAKKVHKFLSYQQPQRHTFIQLFHIFFLKKASVAGTKHQIKLQETLSPSPHPLPPPVPTSNVMKRTVSAYGKELNTFNPEHNN